MDITILLIAGGVFFLAVILIVIFIPAKNKTGKGQENKYRFEVETEKGKITFADPFDNFLVYGGANSGKTKSIGKPLLREYIKAGFAGFIYDYKDFDLTKTAHNLIRQNGYPYPFYFISFTDMERTYRTNPISPAVIKDENLFIQLIEDMLLAYKGEAKRDEWFNGALGILKGVAISFYYDYKNICTIPHIVNFICSAGGGKITNLLESSYQGRTLGSAFLDAKDSPRTQSSYLSSLTNYLSGLAFNKNIAYVLTGDDFEFNLIDPSAPKMISVVNAYQIENLISPVISLMLTASSRQFTLMNQVPFFYFLDEATTFKIPDFEKLPSVLREYKCSFTFITQSGAKIEKQYSKLDRSSIESNFSNQFFGRTKDVEALKNYPLVFGKEDKKKISRTSNSRGVGNQSRTVSFQKEEVYDTRFFTELKAGEFVGGAAHSNHKGFHLRFKQYDSSNEEPLPVVRTILPSEIEENYNKIKADIYSI